MSVPAWKKSCWSFGGALVFRLTPHTAHSLRRKILRFFGASIHNQAKIRRSARISSPWNLSMDQLAIIGDHAILDCTSPINLGARSVVSQLAVLTTQMRDPETETHPTINASIRVEDDAWVAADTLVLPGSIISQGTVVGARSFVDQSTTEPWHICVGHPARAIKERAYFARDEATQGAGA
mgnify:FL=1|tara:strand:+ start:1239 stop:1781 length:543 start_codon:yes stop_codon:yes gene_type:complete